MRDEMDDRIWVSGHGQFSAALSRLSQNLASGFERLHRIEFAAPWRRAEAAMPAPITARSARIARHSSRLFGLAAFVSLAAGIGLTAAVEPVEAAEPAYRTAVVSHADLNLAAPAGAAALDARIRQAAKRLCAESDVLSARSASERRECLAAAEASARPQVQAAIARQGLAKLAAREAVAGR